MILWLLTLYLLTFADCHRRDRKGSVCFRHGMSCLPKWFLDHVGVDVSYAVDTKYVTDLVSSELRVTAFGYEPPDCSSENEVMGCMIGAIGNFCDQLNLFRAAVMKYQRFYQNICVHVHCLESATECLNSVQTEKETCHSGDCLSESLEVCSSLSPDIVGEVIEVLQAERIVCQRKDCLAYLSSITTGTCSLIHTGSNDQELSITDMSAHDICLSVPDIVHCALHTPAICLSLLDALLEGLGLNILLMSEVHEIINNPSNRHFADVYFKVFFSTDECTGCLGAMFSCFEDFSFTDILNVCGHMDGVQQCVENSIPLCSHLFPASFRPAFKSALPDLLQFAHWLCGLINSDSTSCYVESLKCLGLGSNSTSGIVDGFGTLLTMFLSLDAGVINEEFSKLCVESSARPPCLESVYRTCEEHTSAQDLRTQFMVLDQVMAFLCWLVNGDYSFDSLGSLSWFSGIDLEKAWMDLDKFIFDDAGLERFSVHLQLMYSGEWRDIYSNKSHTDTAMLKTNVEAAVTQFFTNSTDDICPIVNFFMQGSIVADLLLVSESELAAHHKAGLVQYLVDEIRQEEFTIVVAAEKYKILDLKVIVGEEDSVSVLHDREPCLLYDMFSVCQHGYCVADNNSSYCKCEDDYTGDYCEEESEDTDTDDIPDLVLWLIFITLLISVPVFLIATFCFKCKDRLAEKKKNRHTEKPESSYLEEETSLRDDSTVSETEQSPVYQQVLYIHYNTDSNNNHLRWSTS